MQRLDRYITKGGKELRMGYTTGSCAAAAAGAAARVLLGDEAPAAMRINTPAGVPVLIDIESVEVDGDSVRCTVIKDAGDDPDVTDGAVVGCTVSKQPESVRVEGGHGVGRVTAPGLQCPVGEAAINPVPRAMIETQLRQAGNDRGYTGGLLAVVDVPEGATLADRTFNPRLGIVGGISILGTSGLVEPMSESALVATIKAEIDSLAARGAEALLIVPGNYGERFALDRWNLSLDRGVKCSNYIGEALDHAVLRNFRRILLLGHAGKLVKLAGGVMNTHSRMADGRMEILTAHGCLAGMDALQARALMDCVTVDAADALLARWGIGAAVWRSVADKAAFHLAHRTGPGAEIAFAAFGARGVLMRHGDIEGIREVLL